MYTISVQIFRLNGAVYDELIDADLGTYFSKRKAKRMVKKIEPRANEIWDTGFTVKYKYVNDALEYVYYYSIRKA